ncbi:hypothetical protein [Mesorhizobium sp. ES1-1]|uniref:hypothetical protein n=1 Tax=Mesorhizobium sp. ES1-1 TaxID=2876629 RepID=UPI001CC93FB1|nr:hypothetical protein [Mesorhizobium sp. ES1-1]MBZ9676738.1 hypothetical protein [Mesorhizobium sp. ES1-1]
MAIARKMAATLLERQTGSKGLPLASFAVEVDLNHDGFPEIFASIPTPNCDGIHCGNFLFVLEGDSYHEVLGDIPGARLVPQDKIGLGAFKRNGFLDIQTDQMTIGWDGTRYVDASTFPASSLDGTAFVAACQASKSSEGDAASAQCQCQFNRFQAIGLTQADLDTYTASLGENFQYPTGEKEASWQALEKNAADTSTGCEVASGKTQWSTAYFNHGDQPQQKLNFEDFLDACPAEDFILTNHRIGTPDRALGLCGCLAREMPTQGIGQEGLDLLARYYRNEISDADLEAQDADLLTLHDKASDACLGQFPAK